MGVIAAAAVLGFVLSVRLSDPHNVAQIGVTVDDTGAPAIVVVACEDGLEEVYLIGREPDDHARRHDEPTWTAANGSAAGVYSLPIGGDAPEPWVREGAGETPRDDYIYIAYGRTPGTRINALQVSYYERDLAALRPGQVIMGNTTSGRQVLALDGIRDRVCERLHA